MTFDLDITTAAASDGLALADIKQQLRILHNDDDTELARLGNVAVDYIERITGYRFITQTLTAKMSCFPVYSAQLISVSRPLQIELPLLPVTAVNSVKYYDSSNADTTWDAADYTVILNDGSPSYISPDYDETWPDAVVGRSDAVRIEMVVGYASASAVPPVLTQAALMKTDTLYTQGGDDNQSKGTNEAIRSLLRSAGFGFYAGVA